MARAGYLYQVVLTLANRAEVWREDEVPAAGSGTGGGGGGGGGEVGSPGLSVAEVSIFFRGDDPPADAVRGQLQLSEPSPVAARRVVGQIPDVTYAPAWTSRAVASVEGTTGTDASLTWSVPVRVFADGSSVDIVFTRAPTQPPQPAPSPDVPVDWYTDVGSVPAAPPGLLWSSVGTRDHASQSWIWQLPIQVEGNAGATGEAATLYYIKPTQGTAIKNGTGQLRVEAHKVFGGNDILLTTPAPVQLYVGSTLVTAGNGYVAGSNGYVGIFDAGQHRRQRHRHAQGRPRRGGPSTRLRSSTSRTARPTRARTRSTAISSRPMASPSCAALTRRHGLLRPPRRVWTRPSCRAGSM